MSFEQITTLISLIIAFCTILGSFLVARYQCKQQYELKIAEYKIQTFAELLSLYSKRLSRNMSEDEKYEFKMCAYRSLLLCDEDSLEVIETAMRNVEFQNQILFRNTMDNLQEKLRNEIQPK